MKSKIAGFGLIELMVAMLLGLVVLAGVLVVFLTQRQVYQSSNSQALIQDADNAISAILTPTIRGSGFTSCGSLIGGTTAYVSNPATPLTFNTKASLSGFEAKTIPTSLVDGAANDLTSGDWTPQLDSSFINAGGVANGSDVISVIGATPGSSAVGITNFSTGVITVNDITGFSPGPQMASVSDCGKSSVFQVVSVNTAAKQLNYTIGPNGTPLYPISSQIIPLQQTSFFVAKGHSGQSALFEGVMTIPAGGTATNAVWINNEIIPGIENMQVLYGIGANGQAAQYVDASGVSDWTAVTTVKIGFLIEGNTASVSAPINQTSFSIFNKTLTVPSDSRLRHTYFLTVNLRNTTL